MSLLNSDAVSDYGFNVVTSVAVEQLVKVDKNDKHLFINVYTLYRNFVSCLKGDAGEKIKLFKRPSVVKNIIDEFVKDTLKIVTMCMENGIKVTIYEMDYNKVYRSFKNFKQASDFKGVNYYIYTTQEAANRAIKNTMTAVYERQSHKLRYEKDMYIITHIGIDLLSLTGKKDVTVIESHTGEFKLATKWYSKLRKYGKNDMSVIPFNEVMYRVYGDNYFVKPETVSSRKFIYGIAESLNWYQGLSSSEVISGLIRRDKPLGMKIKSMFKLLY